MDGVAKTTSYFITALFIGIMAVQFVLLPDQESKVPIVIVILLGTTYAFVYTLKPLYYSINDSQIIVYRLMNNVQINISEIKEFELLESGQLRWAIRIFGVGGLFGYFGIFANRTIGKMTWYATRRDKAVLIRMVNEKKILLTPDDPAEFIRDAKNRHIL